ncbi:hypothetical protein J6590_087996 [Homalodisca vitripennis]|nr:hypothetical protein J6590_087996 [Homalodisca vitripennis]
MPGARSVFIVVDKEVFINDLQSAAGGCKHRLNPTTYVSYRDITKHIHGVYYCFLGCHERARLLRISLIFIVR